MNGTMRHTLPISCNDPALPAERCELAASESMSGVLGSEGGVAVGRIELIERRDDPKKACCCCEVQMKMKMTDHCDLRVAVQEAAARDPSSSPSEAICWMTPEIGNSAIQ